MKIHDLDFDDLIVASVTIDDSDLDGEFTRLPSDIAYWSKRLSIAEREYSRKKAYIKHIEAIVWNETRERAKGKTTKFTQADFQAYVQSDIRVVDANDAYADALEEWKTIRGCVEAMSAKRDMLVQLGASRRQEIKAFGH